MEKEPQQGMQDEFINALRREKAPINLYLVSGLKLQGRIKAFDKFSILMEINGSDHLIFKHAISTIIAPRPGRERAETVVAPSTEGVPQAAD